MGGVVCTVIFMSNPTVVLCCVGVGVLTIVNFWKLVSIIIITKVYAFLMYFILLEEVLALTKRRKNFNTSNTSLSELPLAPS